MKKAVIFLNGDRTNVSRVTQYIDKNTFLIGADGGTNRILKLGLKPDVIIGDFDSFSTSLRGVKRQSNLKTRLPRSNKKEESLAMTDTSYIRFPQDKDFTDGELAIKYAIEKGCKEIIVAGLLGTRVDHVLGNILLLLKKEYSKVSIKIIEGKQEIYLIRKHITIYGKKGDIISFIPIDIPVNDITSTGLQYDLGKYKLSIQGNHGISNTMTQDKATLSIKKGILLVIHTRT